MGDSNKVYGVVVAVVTDNRDPMELGRVKVKYPWLADEFSSDWVRMAMPMAGPDRGMLFIPEIDDEVLVAYEHGDVNRPFIVGCLWNGVDKPPLKNSDAVPSNVDFRRIKTRYGHIIELEDTAGKGRIVIHTPGGQRIVLYDGMPGGVSIINKDGREFFSDNMGQIGFVGKSGFEVVVDDMMKYVTIKHGAGHHITLNMGSIDIDSSAMVNIKGSGPISISGPMVNINSGPAATNPGRPNPNKEHTKGAKGT
jgi:hypothetical protein